MNNARANGNNHQNNNQEMQENNSNSPTPDNECLPQENVAIIEDMMSEEKMESLRAMVNGNVRKKLYFNPAYFEPHLLAVSNFLIVQCEIDINVYFFIFL